MDNMARRQGSQNSRYVSTFRVPLILLLLPFSNGPRLNKVFRMCPTSQGFYFYFTTGRKWHKALSLSLHPKGLVHSRRFDMTLLRTTPPPACVCKN